MAGRRFGQQTLDWNYDESDVTVVTSHFCGRMARFQNVLPAALLPISVNEYCYFDKHQRADPR
jgi:hypothetical protein